MTHVGLGREPLLALYNPGYVLREVERHLKRYRRHGRPFALLVVDIHNMAWVDGTFGQAAGNSALGDLADLIAASIREVDAWFLCTRDQFVIVMDETDGQAADTVAERLATEAENTRFILGPDGLVLEMSFRTAACPDDAAEADALLRAAGFRPS
jgi:diguanylate cyclase (GGDEF)-like protein